MMSYKSLANFGFFVHTAPIRISALDIIWNKHFLCIVSGNSNEIAVLIAASWSVMIDFGAFPPCRLERCWIAIWRLELFHHSESHQRIEGYILAHLSQRMVQIPSCIYLSHMLCQNLWRHHNVHSISYLFHMTKIYFSLLSLLLRQMRKKHRIFCLLLLQKLYHLWYVIFSALPHNS